MDKQVQSDARQHSSSECCECAERCGFSSGQRFQQKILPQTTRTSTAASAGFDKYGRGPHQLQRPVNLDSSPVRRNLGRLQLIDTHETDQDSDHLHRDCVLGRLNSLLVGSETRRKKTP
jgi:hypothetical protein